MRPKTLTTGLKYREKTCQIRSSPLSLADDVSCSCRRRDRKRGVANADGRRANARRLPVPNQKSDGNSGSLGCGRPNSSGSEPRGRKISAISEMEAVDGGGR